MTRFVNVTYPTEHPGVVRAERVAGAVKQAAQGAFSARGAASLLLAAIVASLLVVANQVVDTWTEGHLLMAWILMWTIAFASLALAARPARAAVHGIRGKLRQRAAARRAVELDEQLWRVAMADARVMADISRAMSANAARDDRRAD